MSGKRFKQVAAGVVCGLAVVACLGVSVAVVGTALADTCNPQCATPASSKRS